MDFYALKRNGVNGIIIDRDNCLCYPNDVKVLPHLLDSWNECLDTFGNKNCFILSNSAGTPNDPPQIQVSCLMYLNSYLFICNTGKFII